MKSNFVYERFNHSPPVGHFYFSFFSFLVRKIPFAGIELTSQRVTGLRGTSELPGCMYVCMYVYMYEVTCAFYQTVTGSYDLLL